MSDSYRKEKVTIPALYLDVQEAEIVLMAIKLASQKTGITNNRKNRTAMVEIAKHYVATHEDDGAQS